MNTNKLLSREDFRNAVFARDEHKCVLCGASATEAHHIIERRLFTADHEQGGYFLNNGASVCNPCHILCEQTVVGVDQVRDACGITKIVIPSYMYDDAQYDKWGNVIMANGTRLKGPLFYDESVQKILKAGGVLDLFSRYVKHPRLSHLPWSEGMQSDDRRIETLDQLIGHEVVVTTKMDGEQTTIYNDFLHARSIDGPPHPSRGWVKNFASQWQHNLADNERICGENLFAEHSIRYDENNPLTSYFNGFSMWRDDTCLGWDETQDAFFILGITSVPVIWRGIWDEKAIRALWNESMWDKCEGYVVRRTSSFKYGDFKNCVAKFVRKGHVQTAKHHWRSQPVIPNVVKEEA